MDSSIANLVLCFLLATPSRRIVTAVETQQRRVCAGSTRGDVSATSVCSVHGVVTAAGGRVQQTRPSARHCYRTQSLPQTITTTLQTTETTTATTTTTTPAAERVRGCRAERPA